MNGAQIVYDIFYLVIFNIVVAGMEFNFFLRFSEHKQKLVPYICYISLTLLVSVLEIKVHPAPLLLLFLIARIALLLGMGVIFLKIPLTMSLLGATITKLVSYLASGTSASVTFNSSALDSSEIRIGSIRRSTILFLFPDYSNHLSDNP